MPVFGHSRFMKQPVVFILAATLPAAVLVVGCTSSKQTMTLATNDLATPPHTLARAEYPFDDGGHYVDAWAAEGARRYPSSVDTDSDDEGRSTRRPSAARKRDKASAARSKTAARSKSKSGGVTVTVEPGDTLHALSRKHGVSVAAIKKANGMTSDLLRDGRRLTIPR
jgi:LysM domain